MMGGMCRSRPIVSALHGWIHNQTALFRSKEKNVDSPLENACRPAMPPLRPPHRSTPAPGPHPLPTSLALLHRRLVSDPCLRPRIPGRRAFPLFLFLYQPGPSQAQSPVCHLQTQRPAGISHRGDLGEVSVVARSRGGEERKLCCLVARRAASVITVVDAEAASECVDEWTYQLFQRASEAPLICLDHACAELIGVRGADARPRGASSYLLALFDLLRCQQAFWSAADRLGLRLADRD